MYKCLVFTVLACAVTNLLAVALIPVDPTPTTSDPFNPCPKEWIYYNVTNTCYFTKPGRLNFTDAVRYCTELDSYLLTIHSHEEKEFVTHIGLTWKWLGLFTLDNGTNWYWLDGGSFDASLGYWGYPRDSRCAMQGGGAGGFYNHYQCYLPVNVVCKKVASKCSIKAAEF